MKKATGFYPHLKVDTAASGAVGQAGGVVLTETIAATGLGKELSAALAPWRKPLAVHDPAKVITDLAITLALGGDCLADVALLRAEPGVFGPVASGPTVSRTIDALARTAPAALKAINSARAAARARAWAWALAGTRTSDAATSAQSPLIVNLDATLVTSHSDKELARPTPPREPRGLRTIRNGQGVPARGPGQHAVEQALRVAWFTLEDLGTLLRRHRADDSVTKAIARVRAPTSSWSTTSGCSQWPRTPPKASTGSSTPRMRNDPWRSRPTCTQPLSTS